MAAPRRIRRWGRETAVRTSATCKLAISLTRNPSKPDLLKEVFAPIAKKGKP